MFELRKNKWLLPGQPGYNIWLSVQVFGCPYLKYMYKGDFWLQIYGCPSDNCISKFGCPVTFLVVPGARTTEISNAVNYHFELATDHDYELLPSIGHWLDS